MTTIGLTGFELNVISATADGSITGTASFQTDIKRTGDYALRCNPVTTAVGYDTISADAATIYPRFYMRIVTLPSANNEEIFVARSAAAQKFAVRITSAGKLQVYDSTDTKIGSDGTTVLAAGGFYKINVKVSKGNPSAYEVLINDVVEFTGTANLNTADNASIRLGKTANKNGETVDYVFDDVLISNSAHPAAGGSVLLKARGDGNYTTWTIGAGSGDKWQQVDDDPPGDSDTTYLVSTLSVGNAYTALMTQNATSGVSGTINSIRAIARCKRDGASSGTYNVRVRSGGTDSDTANILSGTGYLYNDLYLDTDPATSAAWLDSAINVVEMGAVEAETTDKTRLSSTYMYVDFLTSTSPFNQGVAWQVI